MSVSASSQGVCPMLQKLSISCSSSNSSGLILSDCYFVFLCVRSYIYVDLKTVNHTAESGF